MTTAKCIAVIFPGIGYTCDKPLLYYSAKIAAGRGYEIRKVQYLNMPEKVRGDRRKMRQAFDQGLRCAEASLNDIDWSEYAHILFIGKSVGTIISAAYANKHNLPVRTIAFTPVKETFDFADANTIVFHGTSDPWASTSDIRLGCQRLRIPLYLTENANHSLETGDLVSDLENLRVAMQKAEQFITGFSPKRVQPLKIRRCVRSDLYAVVQMYNRTIHYLEEHINYPRWKQNEYPSYESVRLSIEAGVQYACFEDDVCVGAFILNSDIQGDDSLVPWSAQLAPEETYVIHALATDLELARQGIATEMVEYCVAKARTELKKAIRLDVVPGNEPAKNLYRKMGFVEIGDADLGREIPEIPVFSMFEMNLQTQWEI